MNPRHHRIRLLCATRHDHLPPPPGTRTHDLPGPSPSTWVDCPHCHDNERLRPTCQRCEGRGLILVDRYLHERPEGETITPTGLDQPTTMNPRDIDRWLEETRTGGRTWLDKSRKPYELLERALSIVQTLEPGAYAVLHTIYWSGLRHADGWAGRVEPECITILDGQWPRNRNGTPKPVLLPHWLEQQEQHARDEQIRDLARKGVKYDQIATELGIDRRTVRRAMERTR